MVVLGPEEDLTGEVEVEVAQEVLGRMEQVQPVGMVVLERIHL
jgi:hypothetical protein